MKLLNQTNVHVIQMQNCMQATCKAAGNLVDRDDNKAF